MKCPFCAGEIDDGVLKCKHCGEWVKEKPVVGAARSTAADVERGSPTFRILGLLLLVLGAGAFVYYYAYFDTSVETPRIEVFGQLVGGGRVNNLGLMQDQRNGMTLGGLLAAAGALLLVLGETMMRSAPAGSAPSPEKEARTASFVSICIAVGIAFAAMWFFGGWPR